MKSKVPLTNKMTLRVKVTLILLSVSLIPLLISTFILLSRSTSTLEHGSKENQLKITNLSAHFINTWLSQKMDSIEGVIHSHPEFLSNNPNDILPALKLMAQSESEMDVFSYVDMNGVSINTKGIKKDISKSEDFLHAKKSKKIVVSAVRSVPESGKRIVMIYFPIVNSMGEFRGSVEFVLDTNRLVELVKDIQVGETGYGYLISPEGIYLAHNKTEKIGKDFIESASDEKKELYKNTVLKDAEGYVSYMNASGIIKSLAFKTIEKTGWRLIVTGPEEEVYKEVTENRNYAVITIAISFICVGVIAYFVSKNFVRFLADINSLMQKVSEGNLRNRLLSRSTDEIGGLQNNINWMLDSFSSMIRKITETAEYVATSSVHLTTLANKSTQASQKIANSVQIVVKGSGAQYQGSEQTTVAMEEMSIGIQKIAESASDVSETTKAVVTEVNQGNIDIQNAIWQMNKVSGSVGESSLVIRSLKDKSHNIQSIIQFISRIASQTTLLALNASIEAARAGEQGRGFSVVANEIKVLATQTTEAAGDITHIIKDILGAIEESARSMDDGLDEVQQGVGQVMKAGQTFGTISQSIQNVNNQIQEISVATEQIYAGTEEVSASMQEMVSIAKDSLDRLNIMFQSSGEQYHSMQEISSSAESLSVLANELQEMINKFAIK